jgi:ATP-dependent RNA helicase RhlE
LATQTADAFRVYGKNLKLRQCTVFGGVGQNPQVYALRQGVDIAVATPGRLMDLMSQGHVDLRGVETLVLDEADRMLDMGFINDIRKIVAKLPATRQTLFFSATMPPEIRSLADALVRNAVSIQVAPVAATCENVEESVYFVSRGDKPSLLAHLYNDLPMARTIVFTRTRRGADKVVKRLHSSGIRAEAIHGDKTQSARERALSNFKASKTPILVATDIASRGIDVDGITHVVNFDLTHEPETYVHRIGRTARAGASGMAVSFCDIEEVVNLRAIEKLIRRPIPVVAEHQYRSHEAAAKAAPRTGGRNHSNTAGHQRQAGPSRPAHERPVHEKPVHLKPAHVKPVHPVAALAKSAHTPVVHAKPAHANPVHAKPTHAAHAPAAHSSAARHAPARHEQPRSAHVSGGRPNRSAQGHPTSHAKTPSHRGAPGRGAVAHRGPAGRKRAY